MKKLQKNIINFAIIAHIDHGKSTLADRLLEITNTIPEEKLKEQFLDLNPISRERGITIKLQPVSMHYKNFILNLIDTPGHIDFSYEVERTLYCIENAILLIDATQGIQAQTIYNFQKAKQRNLKIFLVLNKIDLIKDTSITEQRKKEIENILNIKEAPILISAKTGKNVDYFLEKFIENAKRPLIKENSYLKGLVFDSFYDEHKGVVLFVRIFEGEVKEGDIIYLINNKIKTTSKEVGILKPFLLKKDSLKSGEIGYVATGIKEPGKFLIGETITNFITQEHKIYEKIKIKGFKKPSPVVYANIFPYKDKDFNKFLRGVEKLHLNDPGFVYEVINDKNLGRGLKAGFLGTFHLEIFFERLKREQDLEVFITKPNVKYQIIFKDNSIKELTNASELKDLSNVKLIKEPFAKVNIITPSEFLNQIYKYLTFIKAEFVNFKTVDEKTNLISVILPLRKVIENFHDKIKGISKGYASYYYSEPFYKQSDLKKLDILIHGEICEVFSSFLPYEEAINYGRFLLKKLKDTLPREEFKIKLQAMINGKIVAKENIPALTKDIAGWLYGGDRTRKMKLWQKQKQTKKHLAKIGKVKVPPDLFIKILKRA